MARTLSGITIKEAPVTVGDGGNRIGESVWLCGDVDPITLPRGRSGDGAMALIGEPADGDVGTGDALNTKDDVDEDTPGDGIAVERGLTRHGL